jgi:hypothetical protein
VHGLVFLPHGQTERGSEQSRGDDWGNEDDADHVRPLLRLQQHDFLSDMRDLVQAVGHRRQHDHRCSVNCRLAHHLSLGFACNLTCRRNWDEIATVSVTSFFEVGSEDIASPEAQEPDRGKGNDDEREPQERCC